MIEFNDKDDDMQGSASGGEWHGRHGLLRRFGS